MHIACAPTMAVQPGLMRSQMRLTIEPANYAGDGATRDDRPLYNVTKSITRRPPRGSLHRTRPNGKINGGGSRPVEMDQIAPALSLLMALAQMRDHSEGAENTHAKESARPHSLRTPNASGR